MNDVGIVIIGRNEGDRLAKCLRSASGRGTIVYVDSGSSDGSVALARSMGVEVVELDLSVPFSAARARNAGADRLAQIDPQAGFVQFVDGDCEIVAGWLERATAELAARPGVAVVCGRRRERHPRATIYNQLCDMEWDTPVGEATACGGDAMFRADAFRAAGGFDPTVIAGEEPELCQRLLRAGWKILRVDAEMTLHDAAMTRFAQWWTRAKRAGYAYAMGRAMHGNGPGRHWVRETRSTWFWGAVIPLLVIAGAPLTSGLSTAMLVLYPLLVARATVRRIRSGASARDAFLYALFCILAKFPQVAGQIRYHADRIGRRRPTIIEYKSGGDSMATTHATNPAALAASTAARLAGAPGIDGGGGGGRCLHPGCTRLAVDGLCDVHRRQFDQRDPGRVPRPTDGAPLPREVAYLVNQYPHTSHSFIRREIHALERLGVRIHRFSVRRSDAKLVDPADVHEAERTRVILDYGMPRMAVSLLRRAATGPVAVLNAVRLAVSLGQNSDRGLLRHLIYLGQASLLADWLDESPVDHLHAHFGTNPAAVAALCHALGGPTYSFTMHGPEEFDKPARLALGRKIAGATMVAAISEFTRSQLYRWCAYEDWNKIHVVRCGLDAAFLHQPPVPAPDAPRLVCVGRLCEQKGQFNLVRAAAELTAEGLDFELVLVGDGPMRRDLEAFVGLHNLGDVVTFAGWQSGQQVRTTIQSSRALVLPSFAEGLPVVLMEAFALHRPVISTYIAGIPELVEDGVSGWLCPAGSVPELKRAMRGAIEAAPARLDAMGRAGAARVHESHDAATEAMKLAALFCAATATGQPARAPDRATVASANS